MELAQLKLRAMRGDICFGADYIRLYAFKRQNKERYAAQKLDWVEAKTNTRAEPFLEIEAQEAQQLMDDLWDCGLRPSEGTGSAGAMAATQKHLEDMKTITFHALKIQKKEN